MLVSRNHQSRPFQRQWSRLTTPHGARGHIGIAAELASDPPASNAVMPFLSRVSGELIVEPSAPEQFADRLANIPMAIAPVETDDPWRDYEMLDDLIYDVGMHTGEDTEFYLKKGFRVVGIEANAQLCEECAHKFSAAIGSGQLQIINKAISHTAGTIDFFVAEQVSIWGTANLEWVKRNEARGFKSHPVKVEATTIKDVILKFGMPYYMKVDIEGMDSVCLEGLLSVEEKPKYISVEASATSIKDTFTQLHLLDRLGYTRFKIVPQLNITEQRCPDPAREGIFVDHRFEGGSSGLFGEEVPGEWRPLNSVKWDYRRIHLDYRMVGPNNGIFRNFPSRKIRRLLETVFWNGLEWHDTHATF